MNQREQMYRSIRATRGIQPHPADVGLDAVTTEGGTGRLRTSAREETGHMGRTSAASERSQRPVSQGRSYAGFAEFVLPQSAGQEQYLSPQDMQRPRRGSGPAVHNPKLGGSPCLQSLLGRPACAYLTVWTTNHQPC